MGIFGWSLLFVFIACILWAIIRLVSYLGTSQEEHDQRAHDKRMKDFITNVRDKKED